MIFRFCYVLHAHVVRLKDFLICVFCCCFVQIGMRFHSGMEEEDKRTVYGQPCVLQQVAPVLASLSLDMVPDRAHLICG